MKQRQVSTVAIVVMLSSVLLSLFFTISLPRVQGYTGSSVSPNHPASLRKTNPGDIIARAASWVQAQVPYDESGLYQGYREDCSGLVSMAWGLAGPGLTTYTLPNVSHEITKDALQQGDILLNQWGGWTGYGSPDAHVVIFDGWTDSTHTHYNAYEENPYWNGAHYTTNMPYPFWSGYDSADYIPMRFNDVSNSSPTTIVSPTTVPMPPTETSCPSAGTARAASTAPLVLGKHQNLVYAGTAFPPPLNSVLVRHDMVTGQSIAIEQFSNTEITEAQVSADGQWVLFISYVTGHAAIQMVRMDGQGLQTLYCASAAISDTFLQNSPISSLTWSANQKLVMFAQVNTPNSQISSFYLLNLATGTIQKELQVPQNSTLLYFPRVWIDNTHLALIALNASDYSGHGIYVLDTSDGENQQNNNLKLISSCSNFDISPDHTEFFLSNCAGSGGINVQPVTRSSAHTIFTTQNTGSQIVRVISNTTLLLYLHNRNQDGLYTIQVDGTGLTKLFSTDVLMSGYQEPIVIFNQSVPETWSVASRDASMYMLETAFCGNACQYALYYGSLSGGKPVNLTDKYTANVHSIIMVGWTTM